ncbi:hypothetical protein F0562_009336 [Nyssa sinensis]|uniref:Uncharacterized protein n=1 Tax=Nyssa sinensis TaxID=561372 RepID=A0A5J4ZVN7_9ASTE|nr:hypothetical protein F0562_009336 [Nyssa sinensis]
MAIFMSMLQILTGINSILFYAPVLFQSMGFRGNASLYSSDLTGAVLASSTVVSIATVDRWGQSFTNWRRNTNDYMSGSHNLGAQALLQLLDGHGPTRLDSANLRNSPSKQDQLDRAL